MYSPFQAVYGHDRTHVRRMSVQDYLQERDAPAACSRAALNSRDSNVEFCSKYPVRDRFGRELCVLYQILEMDVQHELRRIERGGAGTRQSGVRLSAEVPRDDSDSPRDPFSVLVPSAACPRGSSFAIRRDSGVNPRTRLPEPRAAGRSECVSDGFVSAASFPSAPGARSNTASPRVSSAGEEMRPERHIPMDCAVNRAADRENGESGENEEAGERGTLNAASSGGGGGGAADPLRFTTVRPSELRATKQLFAPSSYSAGTAKPQGSALMARRTIMHPHPIPCHAYGAQRGAIPAELVEALVAANLSAASASAPVSASSPVSASASNCGSGVDAFVAVDAPAPLLRVGQCVPLAGRMCHVRRYYASADVFDAEDPALPGAQVLLYRWSVRAVQSGANETHRAALGLSLAAPAVRVEGFGFRDGGVTALTVPAGFRAVPLSTVPLSPEAFPTAVKLLLKMLSDLIAKRTVHGGLRGMNCVFFAMRGGAAGADMPPAMLIPVHWEGLVDFSMFVDRNVGRTIPITDGDEGTGRAVYHSQDVAMIMQMLLEHELTPHLTAEQVEAMRRLLAMTSEPTQVANYLIQLTNTMTIIPSNMTSLFSDYELALQ